MDAMPQPARAPDPKALTAPRPEYLQDSVMIPKPQSAPATIEPAKVEAVETSPMSDLRDDEPADDDDEPIIKPQLPRPDLTTFRRFQCKRCGAIYDSKADFDELDECYEEDDYELPEIINLGSDY